MYTYIHINIYIHTYLHIFIYLHIHNIHVHTYIIYIYIYNHTPTTPQGGRGTVLWLTHDHGEGGEGGWNAEPKICIYHTVPKPGLT